MSNEMQLLKNILSNLAGNTGRVLKQLAIGTALSGALTAGAFAMQVKTINSVEILVNDVPISSYDIDQRLRLVIAISGGVKNQKEFDKIREQVVRAMIDEELQIQEAATVDLVIGGAQLDDFFARRAQGVGQSADQFEQSLIGIGSSKRSIQNQIAAEVAWSQLVDGRLGSFATVSDEEVESRIEKIRGDRGKFEYRLAEITMDINSAGQEEAVKRSAEDLATRLKDNANFPQVAQQLSTSPTAAVGGDLGWSTFDALTEQQREAAKNLKVGEVSVPIRTAGGFTILLLRDRRRILVADPLDNRYGLNQLFLSTEGMKDPVVEKQFRDSVSSLHEKPFNCATINDVATAAGTNGAVQLGTLRLRDLRGEVRDTVEKMENNTASELMEMVDGLRVLTVCSFQEAQVQEPSFDAIQDQMQQQRLSMMGRRYLRDLRRDAIIDKR